VATPLIYLYAVYPARNAEEISTSKSLKIRYRRYASSLVIAKYDKYAADGTRDSGTAFPCNQSSRDATHCFLTWGKPYLFLPLFGGIGKWSFQLIGLRLLLL
jgi:hypothetical protein